MAALCSGRVPGGCAAPCKGFEQALVDTAKAAIAHHQHPISRLAGLDHRLHQGLVTCVHLRPLPQGGERLASIPAQTSRITETQISIDQCLGQPCLHGAELHGV